ncbi:uncharacterized protein VP01_1101g6 [Puccinia sorghi]|uniref:Uncharacterized protein n=1 Tax=Puccinia sorghi TaxID=27349 RepID=A0A0L6VST5_9BASI|nr:uncharacterized protein VP01_1101g6 [Puccinia sorghi]
MIFFPLPAVLDEIKKVEGEFEKKKAENEMLQTYVNNLTRQKLSFLLA